MFLASRLRISHALLILVAMGSASACRKEAPPKPKAVVVKKSPAEIKQLADAANQQLEGLKPLLAKQTENFKALHVHFDGMPRDMPGFEPVREKFSSADEGLGRMNAKVVWLTGRIDAAVKAGDAAELEEIQQSIASSYKEVPEVAQLSMELLHEVMPFTRMAEKFRSNQGAACDTDKVDPDAVAKQLSKP